MQIRPIDVPSSDEIGQVARAFDQVHREAVRLAGEEAQLRSSVSAMFVSLSRRSQSLLERLLRLIDRLELGEEDPERLSNLFRMDHLATRMRRNSENLLMLAGHEAPRRWAEPVPLADVLRAAVSEIEQYERVVLNIQAGVAIAGAGVADTVHLLAELLENATTFSAKATQGIASGMGCPAAARSSRSPTGHGHTRAGAGPAQPAAGRAAHGQRGGIPAHGPVRRGAPGGPARHPGGTAIAGPRWAVAQVHLPASLTSPEAAPGGRRPRAAAGPGQLAGLSGPRGPRNVPSRFVAGPVPDPPLLTAALDSAALDARRWTHGATAAPRLSHDPPAPAPGSSPAGRATGPNVIIPPPDGPPPGGGLPIYESVESDWFRARGQGMIRPDQPCTAPPAAEPAAWASPGDDGWVAAAAIVTPKVGGTTRPACRNGSPRPTWCLARPATSRPAPRPCPKRPRSRAAGWPISSAARAGPGRRPGSSRQATSWPCGGHGAARRGRPAAGADRAGSGQDRPGWVGSAGHEMERGTLSVAGSQKQDLSWLITDFTDRVTDVAHALVVSSDGVPVAVSEGIGAAQAVQLSAITSGLVSLGTAAAKVFQCGKVTQTLVAMGQGTLVIMSISDGSSLATLATAAADLDLIAYEMTMLVEAAGAVLTPGIR